MHRFRSISYSGIPVDGWDYVHSPLIKPERVNKDEEAKEEEERKNRFQNVVSVASKVKRFVKAVRSKTKKSKRLHLAFWIVVTIFCGCAATIPCELILKEDNMGTRINCLATYLFVIASTSPLFSSTNSISNRHIPIKNHLLMVFTTLTYNLLLTYAFSYHLPITLALILKNGSLVFQMCVGMLLFFLCLHTIRPSFHRRAQSYSIQKNKQKKQGMFFRARRTIECRS